MSALAGLWRWRGALEPTDACARMLAAQRLYGPDGEIIRSDGPVAIGRALAAKVAEDRFDRGPVEGGGGRWLLTGCIRIDNRAEIAAALDLAPAAIEQMPDVALAMQAWERWREDLFGQLLGDYALGIWDRNEQRLLLARDHLGTWPLHYHVAPGFIAFASMPKGLLTLSEIPRAPDIQHSAEFLALMPQGDDRSFYSGINRVEPAHFVVLGRDSMRRHRHWNPAPPGRSRWRFGDAVAAVRAELDRAVGDRLRGVGDLVGTHLSGGMDSGAVTATAARLRAPDRRVAAFTAVPRAGYDGPVPEGRIGDEGEMAATTAQAYPNVEHVRIATQAGSILDHWDRALYLLDEPMLNPCNFGWWDAIGREAKRRGIGVMLTGMMGNMTISHAGDELFAELFATGRWLRLAREGRQLVRRQSVRIRSIVRDTIGPWVPIPLWQAFQRARGGPATDPGHYTALRSEHIADLARIGRGRQHDFSYRPWRSGFESRLWVLRRVDPGNYRMAALGGHGVDERDPTADRRLIELCLSLPSDFSLRNGVRRALGKAVVADRLPARVIDEPRRGYQAVDWHEGLIAGRAEIESELRALAHNPDVAGLVDLDRLQRSLADLPTAGWERPAVVERYRAAVLRGGSVARFVRRAGGGNA